MILNRKAKETKFGGQNKIAMKQTLFLIGLIVILFSFPALNAQSSQAGSFAFSLNGYTVQGSLLDATVHSDNSVGLTMNLQDTIRTSVTNVPINGIGEWHGTLQANQLSGTIDNVHGTAQICFFLFFCSNAEYVGEGTWTGTLSGNQGSGTFQGTIMFTSSPVSQIPVNQPIPISGNWNASFQQQG